MSRNYADFAVTYDQDYRWWSVGCGVCGELIEHKSFAYAFTFALHHRKCKEKPDA